MTDQEQDDELTTAYMLGRHDDRKNAERSQALLAPTGSMWRSCADDPPEMDRPVFLFEEGRGMWIGGRGEVEFGMWCWGNAYGTAWHNGKQWDAEIECDDDYKPTHWIPLPSLPSNERDVS